MSMIDPKGGGKPAKTGLAAVRNTAPVPADPELKRDAATNVLCESVRHRDEVAVDKLPDRATR